VSICLYSINQFYLIQEKDLFWKNIFNNKQKIKRPKIIQQKKNIGCRNHIKKQRAQSPIK
jgi:hypothetical protein